MSDPDRGPIEPLLIHPPSNRAFRISEHPEGELEYLGDALGRLLAEDPERYDEH